MYSKPRYPEFRLGMPFLSNGTASQPTGWSYQAPCQQDGTTSCFPHSKRGKYQSARISNATCFSISNRETLPTNGRMSEISRGTLLHHAKLAQMGKEGSANLPTHQFLGVVPQDYGSQGQGSAGSAMPSGILRTAVYQHTEVLPQKGASDQHSPTVQRSSYGKHTKKEPAPQFWGAYVRKTDRPVSHTSGEQSEKRTVLGKPSGYVAFYDLPAGSPWLATI